MPTPPTSPSPARRLFDRGSWREARYVAQALRTETVGGAILGAVVLTVAPEALRFSNEYRLILYGLIIVVTVMVRPNGLLMRTPTGQEARIFGMRLDGSRALVPPSRAESELLVDTVLRGPR